MPLTQTKHAAMSDKVNPQKYAEDFGYSAPFWLPEQEERRLQPRESGTHVDTRRIESHPFQEIRLELRQQPENMPPRVHEESAQL